MNQPCLSKTDINFWFPSKYNRGPNVLVWIALVCCFIAVFIKIWTPAAINRWPEAITTLLFIYPLIKNWSFLKTTVLMKLFFIAIISPFIFFVVNYAIDPTKAIKYASFETIARIYLFIPIAWWLGGSVRAIAVYLMVSLLGFFYACSLDPNFFITISNIFDGKRVDFNILNAQHVALFFSLGMIGSMSFIMHSYRRSSGLLKLITPSFLLTTSILCLIGIIGTQTRAAYLALIITLVLFVFNTMTKLIKQYKFKSITKKHILVGFTAIIPVIIGIYSIQSHFGNTISSRASKEGSTIQAIVNQDWDNIPFSSIGIRVNTWIVALSKIAERPLIGHGGRVRQDTIKQSVRLPKNIKKQYGHFHNSYLEFTLGYGILGLLLAIMPFCVISTYSAKLKTPISYFTTYGIVVFAIMNLFESYLFFWMGPYLCTLLCGSTLSCWFAQQLTQTDVAYE